jgi:hypothetical protein
MLPLPAAAILFAVLWTAGMLWWNAPLDTVEIVMLVIAGALAGVMWYFAMRFYVTRFGKSQ